MMQRLAVFVIDLASVVLSVVGLGCVIVTLAMLLAGCEPDVEVDNGRCCMSVTGDRLCRDEFALFSDFRMACTGETTRAIQDWGAEGLEAAGHDDLGHAYDGREAYGDYDVTCCTGPPNSPSGPITAHFSGIPASAWSDSQGIGSISYGTSEPEGGPSSNDESGYVPYETATSE